MGDEDVDSTLRQFDLIILNVNKLPMHMVTRLQNVTSHEIQDREVIVHNQLVKSWEQKA